MPTSRFDIDRKQSATTVAIFSKDTPVVGELCSKCNRNWFYVPIVNLFLEYIGSTDPPTPDDLMGSLEVTGFVAALFVAMLTAASQSYGYGDFEEAIERMSLNATTNTWINGDGVLETNMLDPFGYWLDCTTRSINAFNAVLTITCLMIFHQSSVSFQGPDDEYSKDLRRAW